MPVAATIRLPFTVTISLMVITVDFTFVKVFFFSVLLFCDLLAWTNNNFIDRRMLVSFDREGFRVQNWTLQAASFFSRVSNRRLNFSDYCKLFFIAFFQLIFDSFFMLIFGNSFFLDLIIEFSISVLFFALENLINFVESEKASY